MRRPRRRVRGPWARSARGYTLVALLVGLTVMAILHASVLPLASTQGQRDRESELIFRGLQYAEGIRLFRRRFGRYPVSLKEMIETQPRTLRKLWKDPMTGTADWGLVTLASPIQGLPGGGMPGGGDDRKDGDKDDRSPRPTPSPTPGAFGGRKGPTEEGGTLGPILGVYSKSTKRGFRRWEGRDVYSEWRFTEKSLLTPSGEVETPGGAPGPGIGGGDTKPPKR